jgi:hypothetical protein
MVGRSPSFKGMIGSHPSSFFRQFDDRPALCGSSSGNGLWTIFDLILSFAAQALPAPAW